MIKKIQPDKIILALLILSAVLFPVTVFGLSVLDEGFIPLGIVFGINTLLFFIIYLDMKTKKVLSFISYGLFCFLFSIIISFLHITSKVYSIPLVFSVGAYFLAGVFLIAKGVSEKKKNKQKVKADKEERVSKPVAQIMMAYIKAVVFLQKLTDTQKVIITISISCISIFLICIPESYALKFTGLALFGILFAASGISKKEKEKSSKADSTAASSVQAAVSSKSVITDPSLSCAGCSKYIKKSHSYKINGKRYCESCRDKINKNIIKQYVLCSICNEDFPGEYMHLVDNSYLCHTCFIKKYMTDEAPEQNTFASAWICPGCAEENSPDKDICAFCGTKRLW